MAEYKIVVNKQAERNEAAKKRPRKNLQAKRPNDQSFGRKYKKSSCRYQIITNKLTTFVGATNVPYRNV